MSFNCKNQLGRAIKILGGSVRMMSLARILVGILFCFRIETPGQAAGESLPAPYSLTLEWNPSPSPAIVGCHLYYGTVSGEYTNTVVVGDVTTVTVSGLSSGVTYYFVITAIDEDGQESDFSNEISYRQELSAVQLQIHSVSDGQFLLTVNGPAGIYYIVATQNFKTWTVIGTVTLDGSGSLDFTDPDAASFPQRFYRTFVWQSASP
jgi:Fibronectin type III domain